MMRTPVMNLDAIGIIKDLSPADLPPNALSDGRNIAFMDGKIIPQPGYRKLFEVADVDPIFVGRLPHSIDFHSSVSHQGWIFADLNNIYLQQDDGTLHDISRDVGYNSGNVDARWTMGLFNGLMYMNNGVDKPQVFNSFLVKFEDMPNFIGTASNVKSLKGYKAFMVALGLKTLSDTNQAGQEVLWSHPADPGVVPPSWDYTDPTLDAGWLVLGETDGVFVDQMTLRGNNILYKSDSVFLMSYVGGIDIMGFKMLSSHGGLIAPDCFTTFRTNSGDMHLVLGPDDVYMHDGVGINSLLSHRMRSWLFNNIGPDATQRSFVLNYAHKKEIWIGFAGIGASYPNMALVWNYETDTTTIIDLPLQAAFGVGTKGYDMHQQSPIYGDKTQKMIFAQQAANRGFYIYDDRSYLYGTTPIKAVIERQSLALLGQDDKGKPIPDMETVKFVTEVWPRIEGIPGTLVNIYVGSQMLTSEGVKWSGPFPFKIGQDQKVDTMVSGRFISVRFECTSVNQWKFNGYDLEIAPVGKY